MENSADRFCEETARTCCSNVHQSSVNLLSIFCQSFSTSPWYHNCSDPLIKITYGAYKCIYVGSPGHRKWSGSCLPEKSHFIRLLTYLLTYLLISGGYNHDSTAVRLRSLRSHDATHQCPLTRYPQSCWPIYLFRRQCSSPRIGLAYGRNVGHRIAVESKSNRSCYQGFF